MNEKVVQKIMGVLLILLSVLVATLTKDGTMSLILIPAGLFLIATKDIVIVRAYSTDDEYDEEEEEDEEEEVEEAGEAENAERHVG